MRNNRKRPQPMPIERPFTRIVAGLPNTPPFVAPEALERASGRPFLLRLGANESAFGPSPLAREAMRAAADRVEYYGDPESFDLRTVLARRLGVGIENIVVGSGIDDLLGLVVRVVLEPGETAVTSLGAYPTFTYHVHGFGGKLERVPYTDDRNDLAGLAEAARHTDACLVYLANPDNPTGSWFSADVVADFVEQLPASTLLVLDEAYAEFAPPEAILPMRADNSRVVHVRTFSKAYGMAGARIGYAVASREVIAAFEKVRLHFGVSSLAQAGALAALEDDEYLRTVIAQVAEGREDYARLGTELGLRPVPSAANFVSFDTGSPERARALLNALAARGVFVRMPGAPPLDRYVRVTVGTPAERVAFASTLRDVWPEVSTLHVR